MARINADDAMNEEIFSFLCEEIEEQIENSVRSRILVPNWQSFVDCVEESKHEIIENRENYGYYLRYKTGEKIVEFDLRQTRYQDDYVDIAKGYGFETRSCLSCGTLRENLLYDSKEESWYCPICS